MNLANKSPEEVVINPMTYKRLFAFLRSFLTVPDRKFEPDLMGMLKSVFISKREELLQEGKIAKKAFFVSRA